MSDRLAPLRGSSLFIWDLSQCDGGNLDHVIARLHTARVHAVLIKAADGTEPFAQWATPTIVALHRAGLSVVGWHYVYGQDPGGEAQVALRQIALGADAWVVDAELEYEQAGIAVSGAWAHTYCTTIRAARPDLCLGLTTFALPTYHQAFPYQAFKDAGCDLWLPQVYWGSWGRSPGLAIQTTIDSITKDGRTRGWPLLPVGQAYNDNVASSLPVADTDMHTFIAEASHLWRSVGISWWRAELVGTIAGAWNEIADFPCRHYGL